VGHQRKLVDDAAQARDACFDCPAMIPCGELGMLEDNINYGIWGGMMAAERLMKIGKTEDDYANGSLEKAEWRLWKLVDHASV